MPLNIENSRLPRVTRAFLQSGGVLRGGGLILVATLVVVFSATNASDVLWTRVSQLSGQCYVVLGRHAPELANPVCKTVSMAIYGAAQGVGYVRSQAKDWYYILMGKTGLDYVVRTLSDVGDSLGSTASPADVLQRLVAQGPSRFSQSLDSTNLTQSFQASIDSYVIGQNYLRAEGDAARAIPWLENGAKQPMGLGVFSQLALGQLYLSGAPGVQPSPEMALQYLQQSKASMAMLQSSDSPQAKSVLAAMNSNPETAVRQIETLITEIRQGKFGRK